MHSCYQKLYIILFFPSDFQTDLDQRVRPARTERDKIYIMFADASTIFIVIKFKDW